MSSSPKQEQLQQLLAKQHASLQHTFPTDRQKSLLALTRAHDWQFLESQSIEQPHTSHDVHGWQKALSLCFSNSMVHSTISRADDTLDTWADTLLQTCDSLAKGERILHYCETGFLRMQQDTNTDYNVWVARKKMPTEWREHDDLNWWTKLLTQRNATALHTLHQKKEQVQTQLTSFAAQWDGHIAGIYKTTRTLDDYYRHLGILSVKMMVCHDEYLPSTSIGGNTFAEYREVLSTLIGYALKYNDICKACRFDILHVHSEHT